MIDGEASGIRQRLLHVLEAEVKITTERKRRSAAYRCTELLQNFLTIVAIVKILVVRVRGGDDVLNSILPSHGAHLDGDVPGFSSIVNVGQNVAVEVDH